MKKAPSKQTHKQSYKHKYFSVLLTLLTLIFTFLCISDQMSRLPLSKHNKPYSVSYDHRAIIINGKRTLLISGAIHYPRSTPSMWPYLFQKSKEAGLNTIDTYVFWNLHEPSQGSYDFETGVADLPLFLKLAGEAGLYVNLRIGPYVCAEWNFGGFPYWLMKDPDLVLRTFNEPFMRHMETFIKKVLEVVEPYLARHGGPIILLQMENEYGDVQGGFGSDGLKYIQWAAELALELDVGVPWIMCQQDNVPFVITTCNGFYCDNWIQGHLSQYPNQTTMFTELWSGWFQHYGHAKPTRPVEDLAFSTARWVARGGGYVSYYMWHGGTNFGRWGSAFKTASYDYDAPLTEHGFPAPKYFHLKRLHNILLEFEETLVSGDAIVNSLGNQLESHVYVSSHCHIAFLSNFDPTNDHTVSFDGNSIVLSKWSVTILHRHSINDHWTVLYQTNSVHPQPLPYKRLGPITIESASWCTFQESPSIQNETSIVSKSPLDQLSVTWDESDYLWYSTTVSLESSSIKLVLEQVRDVAYIWLDDEFISFVDPFVSDPLKEHSDDGHEMDVNDETRVIEHTLASFDGFDHTLFILTAVAGLDNFGQGLQTQKRGILGTVLLNSIDVTENTWKHQPGLHGESLSLHESDKHWISIKLDELEIYKPLRWYKLQFPVERILECTSSIGSHSLLSFSIYVGSLGRGNIWVNGHHLGRYWDAMETDSNGKGCPACKWNGPYNPNACLINCGKKSQEYMHLPAQWALERDLFEIVLFEERGADPTLIQVIPLFE